MVNVNIICPICKKCKDISIPDFTDTQKSHLITISIPKGMICKHHFQAFLDKNYYVRGYQKVDIELKSRPQYNIINKKLEEHEISKHLTIEGNLVKFDPKSIKYSKVEPLEFQNKLEKKKEMSLKDIYNEFWEFIDNKNSFFSDFIRNDKRRKTPELKNENLNVKDFILSLENEIQNNNT
ncbi:MAG: hypothetical protein ACFFDN_45005 [Candidatus Hodarchaeota archaeon]